MPCSARSRGCSRSSGSSAGTSFKPTNDLFDLRYSPFWVQRFTLEHYTYLFQSTAFPEWVKNTLIVSVRSTVISLGCSVLTYPTQLIPFASWLLMGYFRTIPREIEESAMADGCSRLQIFVRIVLPLSVPGLLSAGIFSFTLSWNEFLYALIFMSSGPMKTIPVSVVSDLIKADVLFWGSLMAAAG
jgi:multiple sugar transport system permease protein